MANVTVIPATRNFHTGIRKDAVVQKKTEIGRASCRERV